MNISIVDTSLYQLVKPEACNHVHVFISKASQGERISADSQIANTWRTVQAAENTSIAPYHYFWRSNQVDNGKRQAENMARVLENLVSVHGGKISDLEWQGKPLVWLDVEQQQASLGEPPADQDFMENQIWKFINNIDKLLGAQVGIYTSKYAWTCVTGPGHNRNTDIPRDRPLWISNPGSKQPAIPWDWEKRYGPSYYDLWQYSFTGKVPGIMKPNTPSVQAAVDLDRSKVDSLDWFNKRFGTALQPKTIIAPPPPVTEQPKRIEIEMAAGQKLNLRKAPFGTVCAQTWDGVQFPVIGQALDGQGQPWWQIGPEMYVAGWYCKAV